MKKSTLIIIIVAINAILLGSIITLYFTVWKPEGETGYLTITGIDEDIVLSISELQSLPNISKNYFLQGTPDINASYTGISLYYLVTEIANVTTNFDVKIKGSDGYLSSLTFNEINSTRDIIIAYMKDGELLKPKNRGGNGPLRLIIPQQFPGEYNGLRCVKFVVILEIAIN
ncbi:MAG: molybdopterin-dependent oxidoreductase [Asgard group archaeon]|nr:molybdopterin-dependent oxidoreductase [Asgard group archaeon]